MGMLVTHTDNKLCVELDIGASALDYLPHIESFSGMPSSLVFKVSDTLTS
jgi:hypothetical protein